MGAGKRERRDGDGQHGAHEPTLPCCVSAFFLSLSLFLFGFRLAALFGFLSLFGLLFGSLSLFGSLFGFLFGFLSLCLLSFFQFFSQFLTFFAGGFVLDDFLQFGFVVFSCEPSCDRCDDPAVRRRRRRPTFGA